MTETILAASNSGPEARIGSDAHPSWRALTWFSLFRLFLAFGLLIVFVQHPAKQWQLHGPFSLTVWVPPIYTLLVLLGTLSQLLRWPAKEKQAQIAVFIDIVAVTLLMHGTGGAGTSGALGLLLAISVAAGSLLMAGRLSLLFAAFATLGVISQQIYTQIYLDPNTVKLTQAGLLGITFFTVALLGHVLYQRIQETEKLAARRQVDIDDLSILNEFIIQNMRTGVLVVDRYRRLRLMNSAAIAFLGLPQSPEGAHLQNFAPALADWLSAQRGRLSAGEESRSILVGEHDLKPTCHPLGDGAGSLIFLRDNREVVKEAQEIKLASLGRLTASIAHNIRNPLSAVSHAGQLLAESTTLSAQDRHLLDIVRRNSSRIDDTIESVLQLSRSGQPTPERIELCSWLGAFCKELRETRGLSRDRLRLKCPQDSLSVDVDPRHLHQIISNLCDNSLKHVATAQQPVRIAIRVQANPIRGYPMIEVADNGPGIPRDTAREIFEPFFRPAQAGQGLDSTSRRSSARPTARNCSILAL